MKTEMPVKIVIDACKKARADGKRHTCPLYPRSRCCQEECNVPKFMKWLMSDVASPADVEEFDE